jgi:hypothetical protein
MYFYIEYCQLIYFNFYSRKKCANFLFSAPIFSKPNPVVEYDDDVFEKIDNPFSLSQRSSQKVAKFSFARKHALVDSDDERSELTPQTGKPTSGFGIGSLPRSVSTGNLFGTIDGKVKCMTRSILPPLLPPLPFHEPA